MNVKLKRLCALFIDSIIIYFIIWIISLSQYIVDIKIANTLVALTSIIIIFIIIPRKDCLFGYESIGKKIMGLKIYKDGKRVLNKKILIKRITEGFFGIPFYIIYILKNNKSLGDEIMNTEVK